MDKKKIVIIFSVILLLLIGIFIYVWVKYPKTKVVIDIRENTEKIDSLKRLIKENSMIIDSLMNVKQEVVEKVVIKVKEVKSLSPDSTIHLFHANTEKYGELRSKEPTLKEDSTVLCNIDNLIDANIISAKLEGEIKERKIMEEAAIVSSNIIANKDSIIEQNSIIIKNIENTYKDNIANLNEQIKKERRKRMNTVATVGAVAAGIIVGTLLIK